MTLLRPGLPLALIACASISTARAQEAVPAFPDTPPDVNAQLFRPSMDSQKTLWVESAGAVQRDLDGGARLVLNYANNPLVWQADPAIFPGLEPTRVVSDALTLDVMGMIRFSRFRLGVDVPVYLVAASQLDGADGAGTGDIALDARATALDQRTAPIGVGLSGRITLPTATVNTSLGAAGTTGEISLHLDKELAPIYLAANVGTKLAPEVDLGAQQVNDAFLYRLGAAYTIPTTDAGVSLDAAGNVSYASGASDLTGIPLELLGGGWYRFTDDWVMRGGVGRGITPGIGSPAARVVVSIAYEKPLEGDKDRDGLMDTVDACPTAPEDADGFEDEDGCPDTDNDKDGIADVDDDCPMKAEDVDAFADDDGCPDPSSPVRIKVLGWNDVEIAAAEVKVAGPESSGGTSGMEATLHEGDYTAQATAPNYEVTQVGFRVPAQSEVIIRLTPIPGKLKIEAMDPDGRRIPGATYTLDGQKGPVLEDGTVSTDGPSGEHMLVVRAEDYAPYKHSVVIDPRSVAHVIAILQPTKVKLSRDKIDIKDKVFFDTGKASIKPVSFSLLDEVAQVIVDYPEIVKVRIEGHTDSRGNDAANQKLSEARAASVLDYLVSHGVEQARLVSIGYGESKPLQKGENAAAWDKNRRVEFFVEEWDASKAPQR